MKILVPVKRVIDAYVKVRVKADSSGVEDNKMSMNPFDEIALEEAIRLKEQGIAKEVVAVTVGSQATQETLRTALALGADSALCIESTERLEPLNIAKVLEKVVKEEAIDLVIMGKQSIDGDNNQTGQMLAGLLSWPQATFASKLSFEGNKAIITREVDGGLEAVEVTIPAVVTTDLRLNQPRYASLPNIMKAKRKPLTVKPLSELSLSLKPHSETLKFETPAVRTQGEILQDVDALINQLKNIDKVI